MSEVKDNLVKNVAVAVEAARLTDEEINRREKVSRHRRPGWRDKVAGEMGELAVKAGQKIVDSEKEAVTDPLTGLYNRRMFDAILDAEVKATRRGMASKEIIKQAPMTLALIDIDDFKNINDTFGHPAGDELLKNTAKLFRDVFRESDVLVRMGGDEFAVIMPRTRVTESIVVLERLQEAVQEHLRDKEVTLSVGLCDVGHGIKTGEDLYRLTDGYLDKAKKAGKNTIWHPLRDAAGGLKEYIG